MQGRNFVQAPTRDIYRTENDFSHAGMKRYRAAKNQKKKVEKYTYRTAKTKAGLSEPTIQTLVLVFISHFALLLNDAENRPSRTHIHRVRK